MPSGKVKWFNSKKGYGSQHYHNHQHHEQKLEKLIE